MAFCYANSITGSTGVNRNAYYFSPDYSTFMLSDGAASVAGDQSKVIMSRQCAEIVEKHPFLSMRSSPQDYLNRMVWAVNNRLIHLSQESKVDTFGTFDLGVIDRDTAAVAVVGDSPAYHIHKNKITQVAIPRKRYQDIVDAGGLTQLEAEDSVRSTHIHLRPIFEYYIPMIVPVYAFEKIQLAENDILVFCCLGLSDWITPVEIGERLSGGDLPAAIDTLINLAMERSIKARQQYDDITMLVYQHKNAE